MIWLSEHRVTADQDVSQFLSDLPIAWMWALTGAFTLGLLIQDTYNPKSWIRSLIRDQRRIFELDGTTGRNYDSGATSRVLKLHALRSAALIRVEARFTNISPIGIHPSRKLVLTWENVKVGDYFELPLMSVSSQRPGKHVSAFSYWGYAEDVPNDAEVHNDGRYHPDAIMELSIHASSPKGVLKQTQTIYTICKGYVWPPQFMFLNEEREILWSIP